MLSSNRNVPSVLRTSARSSPLRPPCTKISPLSSVVSVAYQRGRNMSLLRRRLLVLELNSKLLLLPVLVVFMPVQLSPPASTTSPLPCGSSSCALQNVSVPVPFGKVRCPFAFPGGGLQPW